MSTEVEHFYDSEGNSRTRYDLCYTALGEHPTSDLSPNEDQYCAGGQGLQAMCDAYTL